MTVYEATWRENKFLYGFAGAFALFSLLIGIQSAIQAGLKTNAAPSFIAITVAVFTLLLSIRLRLRVRCTNTYLEARGLWQTRRVMWSELQMVVHLCNENAFSSRIYGPMQYQSRSISGYVNINFKLFSFACLHDVMERAQQVGAAFYH